ncbi:acetyl-CoA acetyltransferase [Leptolinea sp. HRD-7]|nr:acetyl-CoA acetyltransferase [Leptolinea sp. HRD-7]
MRDVVIAGIGQTPVGEHWDISLRSLAAKAMLAAIKDAGGVKPQALYIGNFLGPTLSHQENLGALLADNAGLTGIEAFTVEAAGASGGAALRVGFNAVASGFVDTALVVGVEKVTDMVGPEVEAAAALSTDYDYEAMTGLTAPAQAALLMQRYLHEFNPPREAFGEFALVAHANGANNPNAFFRKAIRKELYAGAEVISDPLNLFDMGPYADGAAAVLLTARDKAPSGLDHPLVRVSGSSVVIDTLALHDRPDPLAFDAARLSVERACRQAGILPADVDLFEVCDAFSIYALLSLEAAGFAKRGEGWKLAQSGDLTISGKLPVLTMGGCKARGNPIAAVGVYQAVEATLQLRGQAGANQVKDARRALIQCLGGPGSTAAAHVLERL